MTQPRAEVRIVTHMHMKRQTQLPGRSNETPGLPRRIATQQEQGEPLAQYVEQIAARNHSRR